MNRKTALFFLILILMFTCAFDLIFTPEEQATDETPAEMIDTEVTDPASTSEEQLPDTLPLPEQLPGEAPAPVPDSDQPVPEIPPEPEPVIPSWDGIDEDQVGILFQIYEEMTSTGKNYSGWFVPENNAPCSWYGISCENGRVTGLNFENAGFFTTFPESILNLRDLKNLRMSDTLIFGPLPDTLFSDLPKLEKLELTGNFFTGQIPPLPESFELWPMISQITISDNLGDDARKSQLLYQPQYSDIAGYQLFPQDYPGMDLTPGIDGNIPTDWNRLPSLSQIDLSQNSLTGSVPDSFAQLPLSSIDLSRNMEGLDISGELYNYWVSLGNPAINLEGLRPPLPTEVPTEVPTEEPVYIPPTEVPTEEPVFIPPTEVPTEEPVIIPPTEVPTEVPVFIPPTEVPTEEPVFIPPTEVPTEVPVSVQPTAAPTQTAATVKQPEPPTPGQPEDRPLDPPAQKPTEASKPKEPTPIVIVVTATPVPQWYTPTPIRWEQYQNPQPQPQPYYPPVQPYYPPVQQSYPTAPSYYPPAYTYTYPTATPYVNNSGNIWNYLTATAAVSYREPEQTQIINDGAALGFTYTTTEMTGSSIPMNWRNTGLVQYSINYLDANDSLYPAFAMEWTPASELCNESVCRAAVTNIPEDLLKGGTFSLQLRAQDQNGRTIISDPVKMQVSIPEPTATPEPEAQRSFLSNFFHWLFGPIIRLFGGK